MKKVEPSYVTNSQAFRLKELKFNLLCHNRITSLIDSNGFSGTPRDFNNFINAVSKPEHWQVVEWLRVNHNIWVSVYPYDKKWCASLDDISEKGWKRIKDGTDRKMPRDIGTSSLKEHDSPQEAYSEAFDYVFKTLLE